MKAAHTIPARPASACVLVLFGLLVAGCGAQPTPTPTRVPTATPVLPTVAPTAGPTKAPPAPTTVPVPPTAGTASTEVSPKDRMVLIYVPAGEFLMGSADSDPDADAYRDEKPQHRVYLDGYWIDKTEVTNAMYAQCVQAGACQPPAENASYTRSSYYGTPQYDDYPVIYVDWNMAKVYCEWRGVP